MVFAGRQDNQNGDVSNNSELLNSKLPDDNLTKKSSIKHSVELI